MAISDAMLPEFDHEMANTRKTLERVPEDRFDWKPHEKSMQLGRLATHLSHIPSWIVPTVDQDSLDLAPSGVPEPPIPPASSRSELLEQFDENVKNARAALSRAKDEELINAESCCSAKFRHEPSHPPSRPAWCLPASQRHSGARHLWSLCRRRRNVVKTQRSHPQKRLCENANCNGMRSVPLPLEQFKLDRQILLGILAKVVNEFDTF